MYAGRVELPTVSIDDWSSLDPDDGEPAGRTRRERQEQRRESDDPSPDALEAVVVRYETGADRCTIFPRECVDEKKLTTWLSADLSAFVDLECTR